MYKRNSQDKTSEQLIHLKASYSVTVSNHCHLACNACPALLRRQVPHLDSVVRRAAHQPITLEVKAAHGTRVTHKCLHGPRIVSSNVPQLHNEKHRCRFTANFLLSVPTKNSETGSTTDTAITDSAGTVKTDQVRNLNSNDLDGFIRRATDNTSVVELNTGNTWQYQTHYVN